MPEKCDPIYKKGHKEDLRNYRAHQPDLSAGKVMDHLV